MSYTLKQQKLLYDYILESMQLKRPEATTDLGATFDGEELSLSNYLSIIIADACRNLGFVIRNSSSIDRLNDPILNLHQSRI